MEFRLNQIAAAESEPLTLDDVKSDRVITHDLHDDMLRGMISAARESAEQITGRALINQTWQQRHPCASRTIQLIVWPVQSLVRVTVDGEMLDHAALIEAGDIELIAGNDDPVVDSVLFCGKAVIIEYIAGYGVDGADVPCSIKQWMLLQIGSMYEHRESEITGTITSKLKYVDGLITRHKISRYW